jgi:hypothetical protein
MIYTLGNRENYDQGFREKEAAGERLLKEGRNWPNPGGAVWATLKDASEYLIARQRQGRLLDYGVFGVEAEWGKDTEQASEFGTALPWHNLLVDAPLVRLGLNEERPFDPPQDPACRL